jgi:hypothetical protein
MAANRWCHNLEMVQQLLGLARVFAGDAVNTAKNIECAQSDVAKVADGSCYEVESGRKRASTFVWHRGLDSGILAGFLTFHAALL